MILPSDGSKAFCRFEPASCPGVPPSPWGAQRCSTGPKLLVSVKLPPLKADGSIIPAGRGLSFTLQVGLACSQSVLSQLALQGKGKPISMVLDFYERESLGPGLPAPTASHASRAHAQRHPPRGICKPRAILAELERPNPALEKRQWEAASQ